MRATRVVATTDLSVGLVHDYLLVLRGAERTFAALADIWPTAPIYTLLYDEDGTGGRFTGRDVRPSWLSHLKVGQSSFRRLLPLYSEMARRLPVEEHDVVISSSSAFAHGVRPRAGAVHVCYCHTPFRYAWHEQARARSEVPALLRPWLELALRRHRGFDRKAARSVTTFVANSAVTQERIRRYWGRESVVVHPPVDVERFGLGEPDDYYLLVGELVSHKRAHIALEAGRRAHRRMVVVGGGPDFGRLRERYRSSAEFLGRVDDRTLSTLYSHAAAVVVPSIEEFGIAAVEAQASGRPVIGVNAGGVRETVQHGRTGWLVPLDDVDAMANALRFENPERRFAPAAEIRQHAQRFSITAFRERMRAVVQEATSHLSR
jgi:glycosyltransferase involved in cell wall biosynthesis